MVWLAQTGVMLACGVGIALTNMLGAAAYAVTSWVGMSALGIASAYRATRRGLLNYVAWIAPPVCMAVSHALIWTYAPPPGPVLLCALCALMGAAAGEVMNRRIEERKGVK